jgi:hypothetical protein
MDVSTFLSSLPFLTEGTYSFDGKRKLDICKSGGFDCTFQISGQPVELSGGPDPYLHDFAAKFIFDESDTAALLFTIDRKEYIVNHTTLSTLKLTKKKSDHLLTLSWGYISITFSLKRTDPECDDFPDKSKEVLTKIANLLNEKLTPKFLQKKPVIPSRLDVNDQTTDVASARKIMQSKFASLTAFIPRCDTALHGRVDPNKLCAPFLVADTDNWQVETTVLTKDDRCQDFREALEVNRESQMTRSERGWLDSVLKRQILEKQSAVRELLNTMYSSDGRYSQASRHDRGLDPPSKRAKVGNDSQVDNQTEKRFASGDKTSLSEAIMKEVCAINKLQMDELVLRALPDIENKLPI